MRIRMMVSSNLILTAALVVVVLVGHHQTTAASSLNQYNKPTTGAGSSPPAVNTNQDIFKKCMTDAELQQQQQEYQEKGLLVSNTNNRPAYSHRQQNKVPAVFRDRAHAITCIRMNLAKNKVDASQGVALNGTPAADNCLPKTTCDQSAAKYRTFDGTCNNLQEPLYTQSGVNFDRFVPPTYDNLETSSPRTRGVEGTPLPNARTVSATIIPALDAFVDYTTLFTHFGQFVDHDITLTPGTNINSVSCCALPKTDNCFRIKVQDPLDYFRAECNISCLEFVRSAEGITDREGVCSIGLRQQFNANTPVIDASQVYGSDKDTADSLRTMTGGKLKTSECPGHNKPYLPITSGTCEAKNVNFVAGDGRVDEIPLLTVLQTVFLREHNVIAGKLAELNPDWNDEMIYQESRRVVVAQLQHIIYNEFLPNLLGAAKMAEFNLTVQKKGYFTGYDPETPATMWTEFSTAAYRYGHSLVTPSLDLAKKDGNGYKLEKKKLGDNFLNPNILIGTKDSFTEVATGMAMQKCERRDNWLAHSVTHDLFKQPGQKCGSDLASLNIQRGRDHGLGSFTQLWNLFFPDQPINTWPQLAAVFRDNIEIAELMAIYNSPKDVDLWLGVISEKPVPGGIVGLTAAEIIGLQFGRTKVGDRFYFENDKNSSPYPFTKRQLCGIRRWGTIARLMRDHGGVKSVSCNPFKSSSNENELKACATKIPNLNLKAWGPKKM